MGLDFIDITKDDEQKSVRSSGVRQTKHKERINKSVFLNISEEEDIEAAIYAHIDMNRKAAGGGNAGRVAVRNPNKSIVNIDVSRAENRQRTRTESGSRNGSRSSQTGSRRRSENYDRDRERRSNPDRERGRNPDRRTTADRKRNPASEQSRRNSAGERRREADARAQRERENRRKRRQRKQIAAKLTVLLFMAFLVSLLLFVLIKLINGSQKSVDVVNRVEKTSVLSDAERKKVIETNKTQKPVMVEDFLTVNEYSRPGEKLEKVNNIFVHYTANKGTSAAQNRSYFENLGITGETSASAHFIIGFDGEIIQCIPLEEIAYAVQKRNYDSISIECCFLQDDGKFTDATYQSLIRLCAWLLNEYNLAPEDMRRHYDEGGKKCPLYYVEHEDAWEQFLKDLRDYIMEDQTGDV